MHRMQLTTTSQRKLPYLADATKALRTTKEAADYLGVCTKTLNRLRLSAAIHYVAITNRKFGYSAADLDEFLASRRRLAAPVAFERSEPKRRQSGNVHALPRFTERRA
jgi:hypothetical protein